MALYKSLYNSVFRRNYVYVGAVFASAFFFEIGFDVASNRVWDNLNKGRQWKDIRAKYVEEE